MPISQDTRRCKVRSPLGDDALSLVALDARERISGPFQFDCRFVSGNDEIEFAKIIGQPITLELEIAGGETRFFNGRVARFAQSDAQASGAIYQAQIVPWFWFLSRRTDCRIFQGDSVIQILEKVFAGHQQIADWKLDIEGSYDAIPYCVQYRESDFHFASRLMEEWGIGYYFEHSQKAHKMVLFNAPSKIVACPGQKEASCATAEAEQKKPGHVKDWQVAQEFRSGAYALTDYNFRDPGLDLGVQKTTRHGVGGNEAYEIFDYPGEYQALAEGDKRAQLRIEAEECAANAIRANSNCYGFTPGYKFDLVGHVRESFNDTYLITEVHHSFSHGVGGGRGGAGSDYHNSFQCVPHAIPYRPLQTTRKPLIQGVQTATVVGEGGKEIDIDDLGCVYVKFRWDRNSKGDATSSCRIRVSEGWAGKGWGAFFAPRIGQEVIVEFLEGDPDRPIVTGRVYNGSFTPPYTNGNQSGIKSRSTTKGGAGNFNELRFDDTKGKELLSMQAEKDMKLLVKSNRTANIGGSQTESVGHNQKITVGNDHSEEIGGCMSLTVKQAKNELIYLASSEEVLLAKNLTVGAAYTVEVVGAMNEAVAAAKATEVGLAHSEVAGRDRNMKVGKKFTLDAGDEIEIKTGKASLVMKKDGKIELKGIDVTIESGTATKGTVKIDAGGIISIKGPMVKINT